MQDEAVVKWLAPYGDEVKRYRITHLAGFLKFLHGKAGYEKVTPSGLIERQRQLAGEGREFERALVRSETLQAIGVSSIFLVDSIIWSLSRVANLNTLLTRTDIQIAVFPIIISMIALFIAIGRYGK